MPELTLESLGAWLPNLANHAADLKSGMDRPAWD
jgi:hypothetical protein